MKRLNALALCAVLLCPVAGAQVQNSVNQVPAGEGRLPTETRAPLANPAGGDCRQQRQAVRDQFEIQEKQLRREMDDRLRLASTDAEKSRLRAETEQRTASLKSEAAEAQRRVGSLCSG